MHGAGSMEHGARSMEHGAWSTEHGAWSMEHGAWSTELRIMHNSHSFVAYINALCFSSPKKHFQHVFSRHNPNMFVFITIFVDDQHRGA